MDIPKSIKKTLWNPDAVIIMTMTLLFGILAFFYNTKHTYNEQFVWLAESFLKGQLYLAEPIKRFIDLALVDGKFFWHLPPLPAILLVPFVWFWKILHVPIYQWYLNIPFSVGVFVLCFKIAKRFAFSWTDALYLANAFLFASVYHQIAFLSWSWYLSQSLTAFLMFLALYEFFTRKRWGLIGIIFAALLMTRPTAVLGIIFFLAGIIFNTIDEELPHIAHHMTHHSKLRSIIQLILPCFFTIPLLLAYNQARFGSYWESGYALTNNFANPANTSYQLFSLSNIPTNFSAYFLSAPKMILEKLKQGVDGISSFRLPRLKVEHPGVSFFVVSPIFLWLLRAQWRKRLVRLALLPILILLPTLLAFWGPGWNQIGPRYTLDFLPFAWVILLFAFPQQKLSKSAKILIVLSSYFNFFLLATTY
ncbi:MAG: hypothetical protein A3E60_03085 [Candidatus Kerfeldbacteria bacterium RIFCSPHIGHO2_12_FULL_42_13]|nr:MAG: hypothetical protein A3E60_03085 [Candidatus Kerfeldbacteria bacterium RIFCSPHIGHO2_12_FULL_42_13]